MHLAKDGKMRMNSFLKFTAPLAISITLYGCWQSTEEKLLKVGRCYKAGMHLEDKMLKNAASLEIDKLTKGKNNPGSFAIGMLGQQLNDEIYPQGNVTPLDESLKVLRKWQKSSYCQGLIETMLREPER